MRLSRGERNVDQNAQKSNSLSANTGEHSSHYERYGFTGEGYGPTGTEGTFYDLLEFLRVNEEGLDPSEVDEILDLRPGQTVHGGGGAGAGWSVERLQDDAGEDVDLVGRTVSMESVMRENAAPKLGMGAIVRYVGSQEPENGGMEGRITQMERHGSHGDTYFVTWAGRAEQHQYGYTARDLRPLRDYSKSFARRHPTPNRESDMHTNARRSGSEEYTEPPFEIGSQVKLTGAFLRSTGQMAGGEGSSVWTVMGYAERRGRPDYDFVQVDEPADQSYFMDLPPEERPKWRRINAHNLMPARGGKMKARYFPNARRDANPDEHAATELLLYIENESDLSPLGPSGQGHSIVQNLLRKMKKGTYDHAQAPKLWGYLVETGAKRYSKEFGSSEREWSRTFTPATRDVVAQALADKFQTEAAQGEYDHVDTKMGAR